ncbi:Cullin-2 [Apophysomyces ossiformis]|uniref:Cullin-5 n=1 Tax=Apophysomyces ossiformis TaxID=679940 RepID=A0A8H7BGP6_9FUNG|nr:Cullin-2 [Apophysomyces ossiformis]
MCNATPRSYTDKVFAGIAEYIDKHTVRVCQSILALDDLATAYARAFERFEVAAVCLSQHCRYLNTIIASNYPGAGSDRRGTVASGKYKKQNIEAVFELIRRDRDGDDAPHGTIKTVATSLVHVNSMTEQPLQLYIEEFERPYLVHTKRYYEAEAAREIAAGNISSFMKKVSQRLQQEIMRNNQYCHSTSHPRIVKEFEAQYIFAYQDRIIDEFENMLRAERYGDCTLAYNILGRITDGLKPLLRIYELYVCKLGKDIIIKLGPSIAKNPRLYVDELLDLHTKFYEVNHQVFESDPLFTAAVDKAFRTIVNEGLVNTPSNGPEILARYCDIMLKKTAGKRDIAISARSDLDSKKKVALFKGSRDAEVGDSEDRLMKMITLFKYVDDKDVFQKFYSRMLAKRLIFGVSASEEMEANMINRLKEICGVEYTSKLNKMFTDMSLSNDLNTNFKDFLKQKPYKLGVGFDMLILTAGAWPMNQKDDINAPEATKIQIPAELERSVSLFEEFYGKHHSGRRLLWQWNLARGEVRLNYLDRYYELQVGLYQMIILLLFNATSKLTLSEIVAQSGLTDADIMRSIKPLVDARILEASDSKLSAESEIGLNMSFTSKRTKIKISTAAQGESQQETQATRKAIDEDRRMYLQAAIVRIMKSRRVLPHVQLIQEIIDQANSRFSPSVIMIKKCIEQLLEKQFIAREERDTYVYVA